MKDLDEAQKVFEELYELNGTRFENGRYSSWVDQYVWDGFKLAWYEQQAVVDLVTEALNIKEQLNQKLREREEELQKRVEAVESTLRALRDRAGEKFDAAEQQKNTKGADYWSGQFHALDTALHSLGFKDSYDEAGLSHETP